MTQIEGLNPFTPGTGQLPPYLAGRENEQGQFRQILAKISAGRSPDADIVMYGPRGMGKTVLLNWLKNEVKEYGTTDNPIRTSSATPNQLKNPAEMWGFLLSDDWLKNLPPDKMEFGVKGFLSGTWTKKGAPNQALLKDLISECKKNPLVFLLDEAHTMEPEQCLALLNLSQQVQNEAPFLLVLAGTPGLSHFLTTVGASFVERSKKMGIARLDAQATADAIVKPLNEHGIKIDDNTLAPVVEDSQHYPYFIQLWGEALWDLAKEKELQKLTYQEVTAAKTRVESVRLGFYSSRRRRLKDDGLLKVAADCAAIFQDQSRFKEVDLEKAIKDALPDNQSDERYESQVLRDLARHEFIWNPPDTDLYEAGIPSLMRYVLDKQREHIQN
ncbi:AAA family ATPase [Candidatus Spongiihabitans sp.]|uniref:AAA family ATPase n=1 Tax=Candidatus Spongiihabitans sp. TaxID=3101308 RepID=UPI003C7CB30F